MEKEEEWGLEGQGVFGVPLCQYDTTASYYLHILEQLELDFRLRSSGTVSCQSAVTAYGHRRHGC